MCVENIHSQSQWQLLCASVDFKRQTPRFWVMGSPMLLRDTSLKQSHMACIDLEIVPIRWMSLLFWSCCLCLPSEWFKGFYHHAWLCGVGEEPRALCMIESTLSTELHIHPNTGRFHGSWPPWSARPRRSFVPLYTVPRLLSLEGWGQGYCSSWKAGQQEDMCVSTTKRADCLFPSHWSVVVVFFVVCLFLVS